MDVLTRSAKLLSLLRLSNNDISYVKVWLEASNLLFINTYPILFAGIFFMLIRYPKSRKLFI